MPHSRLTRRRLLATTAASIIAMPHVRGAHAAGKLSIGFWDHWVPGANNASKALCEEWGAREKVEVSIDYITSQGNKNLLTIAAEAQARSGHDIFAFPTWQPADHANRLEPVDDIMTELIKQNGAVNPTVEYLARANGRWLAVPACVGSQIKGPCSRIDLMKKHAGIDVVAMYPAGSAPKAEAWTLDAMLKAAEACHKAGFPLGIGLGATEDNVDTAGAIFQSFGANLVDAKGNISVKSDPVRQALEYYKRLAQWLPPDAPAWDNASNNKYLIAGKGSLIMNPPSAWAVAKRDAPQVAEQLWTHGMPAGPQGALRAVPALFLGHLELRQEQAGGQEPAGPSLAAGGGRADGERERRLRPACVREAHRVQGLGRGGTTEGHALSLPQSAQSPDPVGGGATGAAEDRRADLHAGDPDQDGGAVHEGRGAGEDARLGRKRGRRLHADLSLRSPAAAARNSGGGRRHAQRGGSAWSMRH